MLITERRVHKKAQEDQNIAKLKNAGWKYAGRDHLGDKLWRNPRTPKNSKRLYSTRDAIGICHLNGAIRGGRGHALVLCDVYRPQVKAANL